MKNDPQFNIYKWMDAQEVRPRSPVNKAEFKFSKKLKSKILEQLELL